MKNIPKYPTFNPVNKNSYQVITSDLTANTKKKTGSNIAELLKKMIADFTARINISIFLNGDFPQLVINENKLELVFHTLITNAIKYNYKRNCLVGITGWQDDDFHYFDVSDNGIGIDKKHFEIIFKQENTLKIVDRYGKIGIGKGLFKVRQIIEKLGGFITVRSRKGTGSLFQVALPSHFKNADVNLPNANCWV